MRFRIYKNQIQRKQMFRLVLLRTCLILETRTHDFALFFKSHYE